MNNLFISQNVQRHLDNRPEVTISMFTMGPDFNAGKNVWYVNPNTTNTEEYCEDYNSITNYSTNYLFGLNVVSDDDSFDISQYYPKISYRLKITVKHSDSPIYITRDNMQMNSNYKYQLLTTYGFDYNDIRYRHTYFFNDDLTIAYDRISTMDLDYLKVDTSYYPDFRFIAHQSLSSHGNLVNVIWNVECDRFSSEADFTYNLECNLYNTKNPSAPPIARAQGFFRNLIHTCSFKTNRLIRLEDLGSFNVTDTIFKIGVLLWGETSDSVYESLIGKLVPLSISADKMRGDNFLIEEWSSERTYPLTVAKYHINENEVVAPSLGLQWLYPACVIFNIHIIWEPSLIEQNAS